MNDQRLPTGSFQSRAFTSAEDRVGFIPQIPEITKDLRSLVLELTPEQLDTPYRQGGWTPKQVIHHMADNDMNAYIRFKRALTEDVPLAGSYREDLWAELSDYRDLPVEDSILFLEALHYRFVILLNGLQPDDFQRKLQTQVLGEITLDTALQRLIWHNRHHMAQISHLLGRDRVDSYKGGF
nr:putative metal-dependent hydrolase [Paenibacillus donghaensis]